MRTGGCLVAVFADGCLKSQREPVPLKLMFLLSLHLPYLLYDSLALPRVSGYRQGAIINAPYQNMAAKKLCATQRPASGSLVVAVIVIYLISIPGVCVDVCFEPMSSASVQLCRLLNLNPNSASAFACLSTSSPSRLFACLPVRLASDPRHCAIRPVMP